LDAHQRHGQVGTLDSHNSLPAIPGWDRRYRGLQSNLQGDTDSRIIPRGAGHKGTRRPTRTRTTYHHHHPCHKGMSSHIPNFFKSHRNKQQLQQQAAAQQAQQLAAQQQAQLEQQKQQQQQQQQQQQHKPVQPSGVYSQSVGSSTSTDRTVRPQSAVAAVSGLAGQHHDVLQQAGNKGYVRIVFRGMICRRTAERWHTPSTVCLLRRELMGMSRKPTRQVANLIPHPSFPPPNLPQHRVHILISRLQRLQYLRTNRSSPFREAKHVSTRLRIGRKFRFIERRRSSNPS
jgi:hypothetical protein